MDSNVRFKELSEAELLGFGFESMYQLIKLVIYVVSYVKCFSVDVTI